MQNKKIRHITLYEHETLRTGQLLNGHSIDDTIIKSLQNFYGEKGVPYFTLIHNGVKFCEYVGVIQVGNTVIEVLPKTDNLHKSDDWRNLLFDMIFASGILDIKAPSRSNLNLRLNSILDLYILLFIQETEYLMRLGLIKKYRSTEGNRNTLKGSLQFSKHLQQNLIHQERFYVKYNIYDLNHNLHCILLKAMNFISQINTNAELKGRISQLILNFPEVPDIRIGNDIFRKIIYSRKNYPYKPAMEIARLLLLHLHPDLNQGRDNVLALMFDMNLLWEKFIAASLKKNLPESEVKTQTSRDFWKSQEGNVSRMRPDIVIDHNTSDCIVLDTKWKIANDIIISPDDLRQLYVYKEYFNAKKSALIYPGPETKIYSGEFCQSGNDDKNNESSQIRFSPLGFGKSRMQIIQWQKDITDRIRNWRMSD
jgi:5-methylcytosine-specific restriction enzyme subunit McrC